MGLALALVILAAVAPKPDDFRIVNGKLYNVVLSTNFTSLISAEVAETIESGVVMKGRELVGKEMRIGVHFLVKNYPDKTLPTGKRVPDLRGMKVGIAQWVSKAGSITINVYDYGLPNTPENRKKFGIR